MRASRMLRRAMRDQRPEAVAKRRLYEWNLRVINDEAEKFREMATRIGRNPFTTKESR